nr:hypothetical protein Q903MT_gene5254 [Picea sitchensis]
MIWSFYRHIRFEVSVLPKKTIVSLVFTMIGMSKFCAKWRYVSFRPKKQKNKLNIVFHSWKKKEKVSSMETPLALYTENAAFSFIPP